MHAWSSCACLPDDQVLEKKQLYRSRVEKQLRREIEIQKNMR